MTVLTGGIPSPPRAGRSSFEASSLLAGAFLPGKDAVDLLDAHTWRQQTLNSCIAYAFIQALQDMFELQANVLPLLSAAYWYAGAQILFSPPAPGERMPDVGSRCDLNLEWGQGHGVISEDAYPETTDHGTSVPPFNAGASPRSTARTSSPPRRTKSGPLLKVRSSSPSRGFRPRPRS
jgi:hypothetical protein